MCNYTLLPANVKLEKHLWKPFYDSLFSSSVAFLMMSALQMRRPFSADFRPETGKNQLQLGQVSVGNAPVLSHCSSLRNL